MTKAQQSAQQEAIEALRETLKPGDTVYTILRGVSRSGMSRHIDVYALRPCADKPGEVDKFWLSRRVAKAVGFTFDEKKDSLRVGGCGMDMGFHVVSTLSRVLYPDGFNCIGEGCPSNDHNNAYYLERAGQCVVCGQPRGDSEHVRQAGRRAYKVCDAHCADLNTPWHHRSGDYALQHKWL